MEGNNLMNGNTAKTGEDPIDLVELFGVFLKRIWLLVILTVIGAVVAFGYTFFLVTPKYESSALMYVNNSDISLGNTSVSISSGDLTAAKSLVATYSVILESRSVINDVIRLSGVSYTYEEMTEMVEAEAVDNTEVFSITVTSTDPVEAEMLANLYAEILPEKITAIVNGSDVRIVDHAVVAAKRSSPSYTKNTAIGALIGLVIASAIIVIGYLLDDIIHSEDYITETYPDIPLLAVVPDLINSRNNGYGYYGGSARRPDRSASAPAARQVSVPAEQRSPFNVDNMHGSGGDSHG